MTKKRRSNRGWPAGRARLEGGMMAKRVSVSLSATDVAHVELLRERWGLTGYGADADTMRRALAEAVGAPATPPVMVEVELELTPGGHPLPPNGCSSLSICATCDHWSFDANACNNQTKDTTEWRENEDAVRDSDSGMVVEHVTACPGWR